MQTVRQHELQLGDIVAAHNSDDSTFRPAIGPFSTCVVTQVTDNEISLFRPYGTTADFSYTGGVIPYIGTETYKVTKASSMIWTLYSRKELK